MKTVPLTVEFILLEGEEEWDYTMRRHHLAPGARKFFEEDFLPRIFSQDLEDGPDGNFRAIVKLDGKKIIDLRGLHKMDIREIEDRLIEGYTAMRKLNPKKQDKRRRIKRFRRNAA